MLPATVVPWSTWRAEHPTTLLLDPGEYRLFGSGDTNPFTGRQGDYVIGVALADQAKAYSFDLVARHIAVNDRIGEVPVLVYANPQDRAAHIYVRSVQDRELEFTWSEGRLTDRETGSIWNPANGLAVEGPLKGELLRGFPFSSAYDWAWEDFYPATEVYRP